MAASYESYRIFYHVATCESFTMAARILHNSQPNITRIINRLEQELAVSFSFEATRVLR